MNTCSSTFRSISAWWFWVCLLVIVLFFFHFFFFLASCKSGWLSTSWYMWFWITSMWYSTKYCSWCHERIHFLWATWQSLHVILLFKGMYTAFFVFDFFVEMQIRGAYLSLFFTIPIPWFCNVLKPKDCTPLVSHVKLEDFWVLHAW